VSGTALVAWRRCCFFSGPISSLFQPHHKLVTSHPQHQSHSPTPKPSTPPTPPNLNHHHQGGARLWRRPRGGPAPRRPRPRPRRPPHQGLHARPARQPRHQHRHQDPRRLGGAAPRAAAGPDGDQPQPAGAEAAVRRVRVHHGGARVRVRGVAAAGCRASGGGVGGCWWAWLVVHACRSEHCMQL